jgi:hypothetical protein
VSASIETFDTCLKQIMCKYGNEYVMSVEATLGLMLAKHAVTTHMANEREARSKPVVNTPRPWIKPEPTQTTQTTQTQTQTPPVVVDLTEGPNMEDVD